MKSDKPSVFLSSVYSHRFQDPYLRDVTLSATGGKVISYTKYVCKMLCVFCVLHCLCLHWKEQVFGLFRI